MPVLTATKFAALASSVLFSCAFSAIFYSVGRHHPLPSDSLRDDVNLLTFITLPHTLSFLPPRGRRIVGGDVRLLSVPHAGATQRAVEGDWLTRWLQVPVAARS